MATSYVWTAATDGDFATGTNWDPAGVPATGDSWAMTERAAGPIDGGDQSAKTFAAVHISEDCTWDFGANGDPLKFNATEFRFAGKGRGSYLEGTLARAYVESANDSEEMLHLNCAITDLLTCQGGHVDLEGTHTVGAGVQVMVGKGELEIASGIDLITNNVSVYQTDGGLYVYADLDNVYSSGGSLFTYETVAIAGLFGMGTGRLQWESSGTISAAYLMGSFVFDGNTVDIVRTLTYAEMHDDAVMLLRRNVLLTLTTGIRAFGRNAPQLPAGSLITI